MLCLAPTGDAEGEAFAARKNEHGGVPQAAGPVSSTPQEFLNL